MRKAIKDKNIRQIIRIIIISGIVEIIGIGFMFACNLVQKNRYNMVLEQEISTCLNTSDIMLNSYKLKTILLNYAYDLNDNEDYEAEISQICTILAEKKTGICLESRGYEPYVAELNLLVQDLDALESSITDIKEIIQDGKEISSLEIEEEYGKKINTIINRCSMLQAYVNTAKNESLKIIQIIDRITKMLEFMVSVVCMLSIFMCYKNAAVCGTAIVNKQEETEKIAETNKIKAYTDNLTGLWNRAYLKEVIHQEIEESKKGCLYIIDLDNFKNVNDTLGHDMGDRVIRAVANIMKEIYKDQFVCSRIGGDEFMIYAKGLEKKETFGTIYKFLEILEKTTQQMKGCENVTASIGGALLNEEIHTFEDLYKRADKALYYVKEHGKAGYYLYSIELEESKTEG